MTRIPVERTSAPVGILTNSATAFPDDGVRHSTAKCSLSPYLRMSGCFGNVFLALETAVTGFAALTSAVPADFSKLQGLPGLVHCLSSFVRLDPVEPL